MFFTEFTRNWLKICFQNFFQNIHCIFKEGRNLKIDKTYQLKVASYMSNILKQSKYPMLGPFIFISNPRHNYLTRNNIEMLVPFPRVETIRMKFKYQFVKVWLEVPEFVKCKQTYLQFRNALSEFYLEQYWCSPLLTPVYIYFYFFFIFLSFFVEVVKKIIYSTGHIIMDFFLQKKNRFKSFCLISNYIFSLHW